MSDKVEDIKAETPKDENTHTSTETVAEQIPKESGNKEKRKRRRRNYDDYDAEVDKEEKENKLNKKSKKMGAAEEVDEDESDLDDEKLDMLIGNEAEEEDDLAEIDTSNIITGGRRTRGKVIDYKKTAELLDQGAQKDSSVAEEEEDDEDEDVDFKVDN
ncbi:hypothetical protein KAFR_0I02410 [Kazachstania africana CBS 2517]|uniref:Histone H2A.Z-specific chaperone CHZ1 n=1 Tax=Kazachstania africana (strain ATCC 22294 / BCRC 22015 / CBS 2517 / CECT 1963 / NBRC 1671 / NRRL Y-8276) TaxID=1071382 RepID=H2B070_KAZAF|nr:hypothetical protein KAFR_0I02410 [Kazachstania africana CBS 2517]CCF60020.1 hypothetical protein KAFR_0I02410 [Kazachstania africana CBS 2517]